MLGTLPQSLSKAEILPQSPHDELFSSKIEVGSGKPDNNPKPPCAQDLTVHIGPPQTLQKERYHQQFLQCAFPLVLSIHTPGGLAAHYTVAVLSAN